MEGWKTKFTPRFTREFTHRYYGLLHVYARELQLSSRPQLKMASENDVQDEVAGAGRSSGGERGAVAKKIQNCN